MKTVAKVLGCVLVCAIGGAAADNRKCGKLPAESRNCTNSDTTKCEIDAVWLLDNENCAEGEANGSAKHPMMPMLQDREFIIKSGVPFKIILKEYDPTRKNHKLVCDWGSLPFDPSTLPFEDNDGLGTYVLKHDLKVVKDCFACYKLDLIFEAPGSPKADPHIQTGGGNDSKLEGACLYQECIKTDSAEHCRKELENLITTR